MEAHILVLARFRSVDVEIDNFGVNIMTLLECSNEGSDVLESSASN